MQILYAGPFLLCAGLAFIICAFIPSARRMAIGIPIAILAFGAGAALGFILIALASDHFFHPNRVAAIIIDSVSFIASGIICSVVTYLFVQALLPSLARIVLRLGVMFSAFCSAIVVLFLIQFATHTLAESPYWSLTICFIIALTSAFAAGTISEEFRNISQLQTPETSKVE